MYLSVAQLSTLSYWKAELNSLSLWQWI